MAGKGTTVAKNYFVLNTGDKIPAIGIGTWQYGGDLCVEAVATALTVGYRHIDCAHLYGNEVEVGKALAVAFKGGIKRDDLFLTSKLYCATNSHKRVENSVRVSLKSLGVSYLDLYLVHWPECSAFGDATDPSWKSASEYRHFSQRLKPTWEASSARPSARKGWRLRRSSAPIPGCLIAPSPRMFPGAGSPTPSAFSGISSCPCQGTSWTSALWSSRPCRRSSPSPSGVVRKLEVHHFSFPPSIIPLPLRSCLSVIALWSQNPILM